jgi:hypothetical protein
MSRVLSFSPSASAASNRLIRSSAGWLRRASMSGASSSTSWVSTNGMRLGSVSTSWMNDSESFPKYSRDSAGTPNSSMMTMAGSGNASSEMSSIRPVWATASSKPLTMAVIRGSSRATLRGVNA